MRIYVGGILHISHFLWVINVPRRFKVNSMGDTVDFYQLEELVHLYKLEGKTEEEARKLAERLYSELKTLNHDTKNVWRRSRNR